MYGKNYPPIAKHIGTRNLDQVQCRVTTLAGMYKVDPNSVPKSLHRLVKYERTKCVLWTDDENLKFEEGLLWYGRDWDKISEHIGTKTSY